MENNQEVDNWFNSVRREAYQSASREGYNFVEITGLDNKIDCVSMLISMNSCSQSPATSNTNSIPKLFRQQ